MEAIEDGRGRELAAQIEASEKEYRLRAEGLERKINICWWGAIACGAIAVVLGVAASGIKDWFEWVVQPWMVSLVTAAAGGLEYIRRQRSWRDKSDAYP